MASRKPPNFVILTSKLSKKYVKSEKSNFKKWNKTFHVLLKMKIGTHFVTRWRGQLMPLIPFVSARGKRRRMGVYCLPPEFLSLLPLRLSITYTASNTNWIKYDTYTHTESRYLIREKERPEQEWIDERKREAERNHRRGERLRRDG